MAFINVPFPERIGFGALSEPSWLTIIPTTQSGHESPDEQWSDARHSYDVSLAVRTTTDYAEVRTHFHEVRGRGNRFPFKDYLDFQVSTANGKVLDPSDYSAVDLDGSYQLFKQYGAVNPYLRKITRPDSPIQVFRTRAGSTTDITGAGASVTYTTGVVAITGHQSGDTYSWSGTFKVPCRYGVDQLPTAIINKQPGVDGELLVECSSIPLIEVRE